MSGPRDIALNREGVRHTAARQTESGEVARTSDLSETVHRNRRLSATRKVPVGRIVFRKEPPGRFADVSCEGPIGAHRDA